MINPATEEVIGDIPEDTEETLHVKWNILQQARKTWSSRPLSERVNILKIFSEKMGQEIDRLAGILTAEVGKPLQQSRNEINGARGRIQWLTDHAEQYLSPEEMTRQNGMEEKIRYEPLGVICNISAWNYPWLVGVNVFVPALLGGNSVMYKPSEYAMGTGMEIARLLEEAGVPSGNFQLALGGKDVGEILLTLPFNGYFFTGSYKTGKSIYEKCAVKMVPCQLEMGGKDPLYVADDVTDIQQVAAATADGAFYNNGQSCCSVERIYVHETVYDDYLHSFQKETASWQIGAPTTDGIYFGPLTRKEQLTVLENQVADAVAKGATLLTGGKRIPGKGYYFEPTILTNVSNDMLVMKEESFGPVIGIMKVKSDEEAVQLMQDSEYGLTAAVYSSDQQRAEKILEEINAGTGYWNCCDRVSAAVPWSGRKHSGFGVALSHAGIRSFVKPKAWHLKS